MSDVTERDEDIVRLLKRLSKSPVNKWANKYGISKYKIDQLHEEIGEKIEEAFYYGKNI